MKFGPILAGAALLLLAGCNSNVQEEKFQTKSSMRMAAHADVAPPLGMADYSQNHFSNRRAVSGSQPAPSLVQNADEVRRIRQRNDKAAGHTRAAMVMGGATIDCNAAGNAPVADEASGLTGTALVGYFGSKPNTCTNSASSLFATNPKTFALWSDANVSTLANAIAERAPTYSNTNQQGALSLMTAIRAAFYVQWNSKGAIPEYSTATQAAIGNALSKMAGTQAFSAVDGAETVAGVFELANGSQQGDKVFSQTLAYANATLVGGDAYKTEEHLNALNAMYQMLFRQNTNKPAAWESLTTSQPPSTFDPLKKLASYMNYALVFNNGRWANDAQAAVYEFTRLLTYPSLKGYVDSSMDTILAAYPKFSAPYLAAAINYDYYSGDCKRFGICKSALTGELKAKAFPNTFTFDDGNVVVYTAVGKQKTQQLYHAMKRVEAQFKRKTQQTTPLDGDPNKVLKMYVYGSRADYENFHQFLYGMDTNNGGVYIEREGTFYTYERTQNDSIYTLEELLRHEYVHYLISRYTIPGMWGDAPYYTNERLTWFDEGAAEFFAGSTQADGILHRKNKIEGVRNDGANRMTVPEIVMAKYGNFRFYDYATAMMYFLNEKRPATFSGLFQTLRGGDVAGFDALVSGLKAGDAQAAFTAFTDGLVAEYPLLPDFHSGIAFDPDTFQYSDVGQVQSAMAKLDPAAQCSKVFSTINQRVACTGTLSAGSSPDMTLDGRIKSLLATGVNNFRTMTCYHAKEGSGTTYACEVGIRDAAVAQKSNTAPVLTDKGSTVSVKSGDTACLRADAADADGDLVVGYWQQKSGPIAPLGRGQVDVQFSSCIAPAPDVSTPQTMVFELVANDGKDEVRMEHTLTVIPKAGVAPLAVTAAASTSTASQGASVTLTANVAVGAQATFAWTQTAGPAVSLSAPNAGSTSFTVPTVSADTPIAFRVTATSAGQTATSDVTVTAKAAATVTPPTTPPTTAPSGGKGGGGSADALFAGVLLFMLLAASTKRKGLRPEELE